MISLSAGLSVPAFLARSACAAAEQPSGGSGKVLVVVQLSGGNDGLNTVVPYGDDGYGRNRIALRIPTEQVLKIDDHLGFHPQMQGFSKLLQDGRMAVVQGVGYPNPDRSHFRSMDIWHTARPEVDDKRDGWLGRSIDSDAREAGQDVPALHLGPNPLPLALVSQQTAVPSVESLESFRLRTEGGALPLSSLGKLAEAARPDAPPLLDFLRRSTISAYASSEQVRQALKEESTAANYPDFALAQKLKHVAQLIDAGLSTRIYYVSLDGFDTHANEGAAQGQLAARLGYLDAAHFASCIPNPVPFTEFKGNADIPFSSDTPSLEVKNGVVRVPPGPGFGVTIEPAFVREAVKVTAS